MRLRDRRQRLYRVTQNYTDSPLKFGRFFCNELEVFLKILNESNPLNFFFPLLIPPSLKVPN